VCLLGFNGRKTYDRYLEHNSISCCCCLDRHTHKIIAEMKKRKKIMSECLKKDNNKRLFVVDVFRFSLSFDMKFSRVLECLNEFYLFVEAWKWGEKNFSWFSSDFYLFLKCMYGCESTWPKYTISKILSSFASLKCSYA
jgi:hypothetical protein